MGLREMADRKELTVDDLRRDLEATRIQQEEHGKLIRLNSESIAVVKDDVSEVKEKVERHGNTTSELKGSMEQGFRGVSEKLDIVIRFSERQGVVGRAFDLAAGLVEKVDGKTMIIVAALFAGAYLIGQGGANVIKAQGWGLSVDVQSAEEATP